MFHQYCLIHCDSKLISAASNGVQDRLTIFILGIPTVSEAKLIEVTEISDSTGLTQASAVFNSVVDWDVYRNVLEWFLNPQLLILFG